VKQAKTTEPIFKIREIELGPMLGNSYLVMNGLNDGEEIVTEGAFSVDASAQLEGKPSMMNPSEAKVSSMPGKDKSAAKSQDNKGMDGMDMDDLSMPGQKDTQVGKTSSHAVQLATFSVSGNCEQCKDRIEKAARSVNGVSTAVWDVATKKIKLEFNPMTTNPDAVQKAIAKVGHDTEKYKAPDEVYKQLPECCLYRK